MRSIGLAGVLVSCALTVNAQTFVAPAGVVNARTTSLAFHEQGKTSQNSYTFQKNVALWGFVGTYATTVMTAAAMNDSFIGTTAIPIVGPWITMARIEGGAGTYAPGGKPLLAAAGLVQDGLIVFALFAWSREGSFEQRVSFVPIPQAHGLSLVS